MIEPSAAAGLAWTRLLRAQRVALAKVEGALKDAGLPPLAWCDVLLELERAKPGALRPFELQNRLLLAQYNLSRLVARIAKAGYLEQRPCDDDGRGQELVLTPAGRAARRRMWAVYGPAIQAAVGDRLTAREAEVLATLLGKLA
ncbi:MAG: MarR family winged helix-turn-helix transcriptional regulator [Rhodospirillaceae bacterium]